MGSAGGAVGLDSHFSAVDIFQDLFADDIASLPGTGDSAVVKQNELLAVLGGQVQVVTDYDYGELTVAMQATQKFVDADLVGNIQMAGGLVEHEQIGLLSKGHGNKDPLALAGRNLGDQLISQIGNGGVGHGVGGNPVVAFAQALETLEVRVSAKQNDLLDGEWQVDVYGLSQTGEPFG